MIESKSRGEFEGQEMTLLELRVALEKRINYGILKLLLCDLEKLPAIVILQLEKDLEEWNGGI